MPRRYSSPPNFFIVRSAEACNNLPAASASRTFVPYGNCTVPLSTSPSRAGKKLRGTIPLTTRLTVTNNIASATATAEYVARVTGTAARIVDTRKTAPGLRLLDKYAVRCGGGMNHRVGLFDGVLIKNNHLVFHPSVADAVRTARQRLGHLARIEVEVTNQLELDDAIVGGADVIMLDNYTPDETRRAVLSVAGRVPLESSGGITLENVREYAEAGVDYVSVGALTHSVTGADIHLQVRPD